MDLIRRLYVRSAEFGRGQTMTEYALILATIAAVLIGLFQSSGTIVSLLVSHVDPLL